MLTVENTVLIVIDMQEKLARAMHDRENLVKRAAQMVNGAKVSRCSSDMDRAKPRRSWFHPLRN